MYQEKRYIQLFFSSRIRRDIKFGMMAEIDNLFSAILQTQFIYLYTFDPFNDHFFKYLCVCLLLVFISIRKIRDTKQFLIHYTFSCLDLYFLYSFCTSTRVIDIKSFFGYTYVGTNIFTHIIIIMIFWRKWEIENIRRQ